MCKYKDQAVKQAWWSWCASEAQISLGEECKQKLFQFQGIFQTPVTHSSKNAVPFTKFT